MTTLHPDWLAFFESLLSTDVEFVVVGGLAVGVHAEPRATDDLDVFVRASRANAKRLQAALRAFGFGSATPSVARLATPNRVFMIGRKPLRIDILNAIDGVTFGAVWEGRVVVSVDGVTLPFIGRAELIANKKAAGRDKDLVDLVALARIPPRDLERPAPARRRDRQPAPSARRGARRGA